MLAQIWSAAVRGIDGYPVVVELDLANGLPNFVTVGLPDVAVKESRDRVMAALRNSGYDFPCSRVTVNLAPAQYRKRGTQFDLPVAMGVLAASSQLPAGAWMSRYSFMGELTLDGGVKPVSGVLPMAAAARQQGMSALILPQANAHEGAAVGIASYGISSLREAVGFVTGQLKLEAAQVPSGTGLASQEDLADVKGMLLAKRALEIAAAGGHNLLLVGPPGAGKSMLARRLTGLLPLLGQEEALEVAKIRSVAGLLPAGKWCCARPFRAPHHTATMQALVGGGSPCRPGEVTLAHRGVLFLDELAEFDSQSLDALRVPLESRRAVVCRVQETAEYPADFQLIAAMNPCACGYLGHPTRACVCTPGQIARYRCRISGPLLDRIDLRVEVVPLSFQEWEGVGGKGESSAPIRERVLRARAVQAARLGSHDGTNAGMGQTQLKEHCRLEPEARELLHSVAARFSVSARSLDRILKVARTIADMEDSVVLNRRHVSEAVALSGRDQGSLKK